MRISYAMLYPKKAFKKNDRIKNNDKYGRISKIEKENIQITYDDKSVETINKKDASAILEIVNVTTEVIPELIKENKVTVDKVTNILKDLYLVNSKVEVIDNVNFSKKDLYQIILIIYFIRLK